MRYGKQWILLLSAAFALLAVLFWRQEPQVQPPLPEQSVPLSVLVSPEGRTEQITCWEDGSGNYYLFLPSFADPARTEFYLEPGTECTLDGIPLISGQNCAGLQPGNGFALEYTRDGETRSGSLRLLHSAQLPSLYIRTQSGNMDYIHAEKGNKESGTIHMYDTKGVSAFAGNLKSISGRGNGTWVSEKKSYSLTLAGEADLLGTGAAQRWILLANDGDPSLLRNKLVYDFARDADLAYSPESDWVDLYVNGEYAGLYQLCERNEIHPQRVALEENDSFLVSLELEKRLVEQEIPYVSTDSTRALRIHHSSLEDAALQALWQSAENAIFAEDGIDPVTGKRWTELIDLDSWARKYLVEELFGNGDAGGLSQFFYGNGADGVIFAGPVWDFDISMGSSGVWQQRQPEAFFANRERLYRGMETSWYHALWQKPEFSQQVIRLYREEYRALLESWLQEKLDAYVSRIREAAVLNHYRWNRATAEEAAAQIREYMLQRMTFLDSVWLEGEVWHRVLVDINDGSNIACYAVRPGEPLPQLPDTSGIYDAIGWYHRGTDEPVAENQLVNGDLDIYCKRKYQDMPEQETESKSLSRTEKLPLAVFLVLLLAALLREISGIFAGNFRQRQDKSKAPRN